MDRSERREKLRRARYERTRKAGERRARYETSNGQQTRAEYATSQARQQTRNKYEQGTGKQTRAGRSLDEYINRQIIAVDGEGVTDQDGRHRYVLLAASTGETLFKPEGIASKDALTWLIDLRRAYPAALFVSFGFSYDITQILIDVSRPILERLRNSEYIKVGKWRLWWRPGRNFGVGYDVNLTIWDLRSFFRGSFISALEQFITDIPAEIVDGKAGRDLFTIDNIDNIKSYNQIELDYMVMLAKQIRGRLFDLGIRLNRFDGSGAIAAALLRNRDVKQHVPELDKNTARLMAGAFIGGRIECVQYGTSNRGGYQYDMRAAYPWAMTLLPSFQGKWVKHSGDPGQLPYTVYKITWSNWHNPYLPAPLPYRTPNGAITFPSRGKALIWSPEIDIVRNLPAGSLDYKITEAYQFIPNNPDLRPWTFTRDLYELRQGLEAVGNYGAAAVLKLGTNAMWGKLAQRIGHTETYTPAYHHLGAAGLVTSIVRAKLYETAQADLGAVVAIETDAIITRRRLPNAAQIIGPNMGEWKETKFNSLTYVNSGLAFATITDGRQIRRTAGIPRGHIKHQDVTQAIAAGLDHVQITRPYFQAINICQTPEQWDNLGQWNEKTENISVNPTGKRIPAPGPTTRAGWNPTICPVFPTQLSSRYLVPWDLDTFDLEQYLEQQEQLDLTTDVQH